MIASFSFASMAHVTQWSNYLTQRAEILTRRSNLLNASTSEDLYVVSGTEVACYIRQAGFTGLA